MRLDSNEGFLVSFNSSETSHNQMKLNTVLIEYNQVSPRSSLDDFCDLFYIRLWLLCSSFISFTSIGFPFTDDGSSPKHQRFTVIQTCRKFYDANGGRKLLMRLDLWFQLLTATRLELWKRLLNEKPSTNRETTRVARRWLTADSEFIDLTTEIPENSLRCPDRSADSLWTFRNPM